MTSTLGRLCALFAIALAAFLFSLPAAQAQPRFDDGTTLDGFVLDSDGFAWHKAKPPGAGSLKPNPQARFIADPTTNRGGNALHPQSHGIVEEIARDLVKRAGSTARWEIRWEDGTGLAGGYQLVVTSERGERKTSAAWIAVLRMKKSRQAVVDDLYHEHISIL